MDRFAENPQEVISEVNKLQAEINELLPPPPPPTPIPAPPVAPVERPAVKGVKVPKKAEVAEGAVKRPDLLLDEMLRIGDEAIVTFPNFGYWRTRFLLLLKGRMPMSETFTYNWNETTKIPMCTFSDCAILCP